MDKLLTRIVDGGGGGLEAIVVPGKFPGLEAGPEKLVWLGTEVVPP